MRFELEFDETFEGETLDASRWLPYYLPHWSSRRRSAARYELSGGELRLLIEDDQQPWCPELDGEVRVSSLQTGEFAGPVGSSIGQHRFNQAAVVREAQPNVRLYTPQYGRIELRAKALDDPRAMVALWMIGYEDEPHRAAEICICEIFGRDVAAHHVGVGMGVHPFGDPQIVDDFSRETVELDARDFHVYAAEWTPDGVTFFVDGSRRKRVDQSPAYPMQLMLGIYELPAPDGDEQPPSYPKAFVVDYVRGYRSAGDDGRARLPFERHRPRTAAILSGMPPKRIRPKSLADYLEVLSKIAFQAGLSGRVVEAKWDAIRKAFHGFDPDRVARMTPRAVDKLVADERVIRSRSKIEATIANAETMLELDEEYRGFKRYLRSHDGFEATVKDLRKRFKFLGDSGAYRFLWIVGEKVPSYQEWAHSRGAAPGHGGRRR